MLQLRVKNYIALLIQYYAATGIKVKTGIVDALNIYLGTMADCNLGKSVRVMPRDLVHLPYRMVQKSPAS